MCCLTNPYYAPEHCGCRKVVKLWEWVGEKPDRQLKVLLSSILDIEEPPAGLP